MLWSPRAHTGIHERQTFPSTSSKWKEPKWRMHSILILLLCDYKSPNSSAITCHTGTELTGNLEMYRVFCHPLPAASHETSHFLLSLLKETHLVLFGFVFVFHLANCDLIVGALGMVCLWTLRYPVLVKALSLGSLSPPSKWKLTERRKSIPATSLALGFLSAG